MKEEATERCCGVCNYFANKDICGWGYCNAKDPKRIYYESADEPVYCGSDACGSFKLIDDEKL